MPKHICGQCAKTFTSEAVYLGHECQVTGYTPIQPQHLNTPPKSSKLTEKNIVAAVRSIRRGKIHV